jgi:hypothetical protein
MINAVNLFLKAANDNTKATARWPPKANLEEYRDMLVAARDRIRKLRDEGKTEEQVGAAKPLADLDAKWSNPANPRPRSISCGMSTIHSRGHESPLEHGSVSRPQAANAALGN